MTFAWTAFFLGMLSAFVIAGSAISLIVWWETRCKRIRALEQFEHVNADEVRTTVYSSPSYGLRVVK